MSVVSPEASPLVNYPSEKGNNRDFGAHVGDAVDGFADGFADFGGNGAFWRSDGG